MITLPFVKTLSRRFKEKNPLIQIVLGPRQVGKTIGVGQFLKGYKGLVHSTIAEESFGYSQLWLREQWQKASELGRNALFVVDEIQKIENWSETIKFLWDDSIRRREPMKCLLLGSSSLEIQRGLTESLAGRFEVIGVPHWDFAQSTALNKMTFESYLRVGGYPGSYRFLKDETRWRYFIRESIVENVLNKDILAFNQIRKPALFRQAVELLFSYPAQTISYTKILGQLQDHGNVETVKNYIRLLEGAFLLMPTGPIWARSQACGSPSRGVSSGSPNPNRWAAMAAWMCIDMRRSNQGWIDYRRGAGTARRIRPTRIWPARSWPTKIWPARI